MTQELEERGGLLEMKLDTDQEISDSEALRIVYAFERLSMPRKAYRYLLSRAREKQKTSWWKEKKSQLVRQEYLERNQ